MNIPIYRAKKIDSDEFIEGWLYKKYNFYGIYTIDKDGNSIYTATDIDPNTLAIHFPNMIDKNGKKIFASLSENGVGGDKLELTDCEQSQYVASFNSTMFSYGAVNINKSEDEWYFESFYELDGLCEVIGIHKGE